MFRSPSGHVREAVRLLARFDYLHRGVETPMAVWEKCCRGGIGPLADISQRPTMRADFDSLVASCTD